VNRNYGDVVRPVAVLSIRGPAGASSLGVHVVPAAKTANFKTGISAANPWLSGHVAMPIRRWRLERES